MTSLRLESGVARRRRFPTEVKLAVAPCFDRTPAIAGGPRDNPRDTPMSDTFPPARRAPSAICSSSRPSACLPLTHKPSHHSTSATTFHWDSFGMRRRARIGRWARVWAQVNWWRGSRGLGFREEKPSLGAKTSRVFNPLSLRTAIRDQVIATLRAMRKRGLVVASQASKPLVAITAAGQNRVHFTSSPPCVRCFPVGRELPRRERRRPYLIKLTMNAVKLTLNLAEDFGFLV